MTPIDDVIANLESQELGQKLVLAEFARKWGIGRATLSRRWRCVTGPRSDGYAQQQAISAHQESELCTICYELTKQGLPSSYERDN